jgi:hypothetical protein
MKKLLSSVAVILMTCAFAIGFVCCLPPVD